MNISGKAFNIICCCLTICTINSSRIYGQAGSGTISQNIPRLKQITTDVNQNVLALLALIKEYEKYEPSATSNVAKVLKPLVAVKETDNINSVTIADVRQNDEFLIIEERDNWYKIRIQDNREGWLSEADIQILNKQLSGTSNNLKEVSNHETSVLLEQMTRYKKIVDGLSASADTIIKKMEETYTNLSNDKKKTIESDYRSILGYKEKIEKYLNYTNRFLTPYENLLRTPNDSKSLRISAGERFTGTVFADVGKSSYQNMNSNSTTSTQLGFNSIFQIDKSSSINVTFNHQDELIQTAFSDNRIEAGISKQFHDKLTLSGNFGYDNYHDKATDNNSFGHFITRVNAAYTPTRQASIYGNASFQSKSFKASGDDNYQGIMYVFGTDLMSGSRSKIKLQIQGNKQSSDKDFLNFNQFRPQFSYTFKRNQRKSFTFGLEYDLLKFEGSNNFNDYQKYRADFLWRKSAKTDAVTRNIDIIYKKFPSNSKQDYVRLESRREKRVGSYMDERSSISSFSYLLTLITQRTNNFLDDYLDIRWDRSKIRPRSYCTTNIYTRIWNNFKKMAQDSAMVPDHSLDFYSEFGPYFRNRSDASVKLTALKVGFIMGGHLFFNIDKDYFFRNGNSARGGVALSSNLKIFKATLVMSGSYERSIILCKETVYNPLSGNIVYGNNLYRKPSSFQFNIDFRQPISNNWDIHFNLGTYDIWTDATTETSINPVDRKSNLRVNGGVVYRFAL